MTKKILVVDDEPLICEILRDYLELNKFQVSEAYSGHQAFEMICLEHFDVIISDMRMPNGDGTELAKKIAAMPEPKPKVFLTTGYSEINDIDLKKLGIVKVLHKPFLSEDFIGSIKEVF